MKVNPDSQRGARHRHQCVRFVGWVEWDSSDSLVDGVEQEGAHTCSETGWVKMSLMLLGCFSANLFYV